MSQIYIVVLNINLSVDLGKLIEKGNTGINTEKRKWKNGKRKKYRHNGNKNNKIYE